MKHHPDGMEGAILSGRKKPMNLKAKNDEKTAMESGYQNHNASLAGNKKTLDLTLSNGGPFASKFARSQGLR